MSEGLRRRIQADYSLPVGAVYRRIALAQIEHFGRLDALRGCIDTGMEGITAAPSWVPDLILPPPSSESIRQQFSAGMSRTVARYADPGILEVAGVRAARHCRPGGTIRLGLLQGWERLDADRTVDDPEIFQKFRNLSAGEVINYDPRMSLDALKLRGLVTSTFCLS